MAAAANQSGRCVETIVFPVLDVNKASGWEARARAMGVRIDSVPIWRLGRVACFVSLGASTIFISQAKGRQTNHSVIAPSEGDFRLIAALNECGLCGEIQPEEVAA